MAEGTEKVEKKKKAYAIHRNLPISSLRISQHKPQSYVPNFTGMNNVAREQKKTDPVPEQHEAKTEAVQGEDLMVETEQKPAEELSPEILENGDETGHESEEFAEDEEPSETEPREITVSLHTSEADDEPDNDDEDEDSILSEDDNGVDLEAWVDSVNSDAYLQLWRLDPDESFSDYTIEVVHVDGEGEQHKRVYNVHKAMLAVGHHRCQYFAHLFQGDHYPEIRSNVIKIQLKEPAAKAFPQFLDLLYAPKLNFFVAEGFELAELVGLHHLANFFQAATLLKVIDRIMRRSLTHDNVAQFYEAATAFTPPEEAVLEYIEKFCTRNIMKLEPNSPLLKMMNADFFVRLVSSDINLTMRSLKENADASETISSHLSDLVAACCEIHEIDEELFQIFTSAEYIPVISFHAARKLLLLEHSIVRNEQQSTQLSDLQQRCLSAIRENIDDINFGDPSDETLKMLRTLPSATVVDLMILIHTKSGKK